MAMSTGGAGGGVTSEINVTPMIDVLLVLLIIFMIVNALSRTVIEVQIPPSETAAAQSSQSNQIVLEMKPDGSYAINGQTPFQLPQLDSEIHNIYDNRPAKLIFVKPAGTRVYGEVMEAIDIVRGAGVEVVGFTPVEAN
jgi:biopolymer transport protein ExbD